MNIRPATPEDAPSCTELVEGRRRAYEVYQPRFWKKAENSASATLPWFQHLFADAKNVCLIAVEDGRVVGFLIAKEFPTPPVYDPGGATALIDDFCVASKERWQDLGHALLGAAKAILKERGYTQIVMVGARQDEAKTDFLQQSDLSLASTWWTAGLS